MIGVKTLSAPEWNVSEILRYARAEADDEIMSLINECMHEAEQALQYKVSFTLLPIDRAGDSLRFGVIDTDSQTVMKAVKDCDSLLLFAATVGTPFDRLIQKYSRISPSKALILHAIGAERVEALCDQFSADYGAESGVRLRPRVSPGYGDIPLAMQREIFMMLDCSRKIGLTLNEDLLMSPSKSVTAIAGIASLTESDEPSAIICTKKCSQCDQTSCVYREG